MGSIGWYIFRTTLGAFWLILGSLTLVVWLDTVVRDLDLMTGQGQTALEFLGLMSLAIPQLILIIAPIAFMIAAAHTLSRLAYFKAPGYIAFCDELPLTPTEKIQRARLGELARERVGIGSTLDLRSMKKRTQ